MPKGVRLLCGRALASAAAAGKGAAGDISVAEVTARARLSSTMDWFTPGVRPKSSALRMSRGTSIQFNKPFSSSSQGSALGLCGANPWAPPPNPDVGCELPPRFSRLQIVEFRQAEVARRGQRSMGRSDMFLHLIFVWLVANTAVIAYLMLIYFANSLSEKFTKVTAAGIQAGRVERRARILMINDLPSPQSGRGF